MSGSVNKVIIIGNLGADPQVRYTQSGSVVCGFPVAVSDKWTDKQGQKQERVEWVRISVWGKQAEQCAEYLAKGRQVYLEGRIKTTAVDKNGSKVYYTEVVAHVVQFLGVRPEGQQRQQSQQNEPPPPAAQDYVYEADDVPF